MKLKKSDINGYFCPDDPGEPVWNTQRLSINDLEARFISEFAHGKNVLEIGTGLGVATRALAATAKHVYTVDIDPWVKESVELPDNATFFDSAESLVTNSMDMAFIDGCHEERYVIEDIKICRRIVKKGGLLLFHDTNMTSVRNGIAKSGLSAYGLNFEAGIGIGWND